MLGQYQKTLLRLESVLRHWCAIIVTLWQQRWGSDVGPTETDWLDIFYNTKAYKNFCKRAGLTNLIKVNTHYGSDADPSSCIDHFLTSAVELYSQCGVCPYMESDHMVIFGSRKKFKIKRD